jgi:hypothetical protein
MPQGDIMRSHSSRVSARPGVSALMCSTKAFALASVARCDASPVVTCSCIAG